MKQKKIFMMTSVLFMLSIWGFIFFVKDSSMFKGLDLLIFVLVIVFGVFALVKAFKAEKDQAAGIPVEDELSLRIKHKAGYWAFLSSMYLWLIIFALKIYFTDVGTMLSIGILLSFLIYMLIKLVLKKQVNGK